MADMAHHALRAAAYAIRAAETASGSERDGVPTADQEHSWQRERPPEEIRTLVLSASEIDAHVDSF